MKTKRHYILSDFLKNPQDVCHVNRVTIHSTEKTYRQDHFYHDHDSPEIFWIEEGEGWLLINDQKLEIEKGTLVMMRADDSHTFFAKDSNTELTLTNVAFKIEIQDYFKENYFPKAKTYFWTKEELPFITKLDDFILQKISLQATRLFDASSKNRLKLDFFLLMVFSLLENKNEGIQNIQDLPEWFNKALKTYKTPEYFKKGIHGFVEIAQRSPDHINFIAKKHLGKTLSDIINKARMEYAVFQLNNTDASIKSIYNACGFANKSHFYKVFKKHFNITPSKYRKHNSPIV